MIKRLCICLNLILFICTLSGCQGGQSVSLDVQTEIQTTEETESQFMIEIKNESESESTLLEPIRKTIEEMVQVPEKYEGSVRLGDPEWPVQLDFDASFVLPDVDGMDVVSIEFNEYSEEDIAKIAETVFPAGYCLWSQGEIDVCVETLQEYIGKYKSEIEWNESEATEVSKEYYDAINADYRELLWIYEFLANLLSGKKCTIANNFTCVSKENANGDLITAYLSVIKDDEYIGSMLVINDRVDYWWIELEDATRFLANGFWQELLEAYYDNLGAFGAYNEWMCTDLNNQSIMTEEDIDKAVSNILDEIGISDYEKKSTVTMWTPISFGKDGIDEIDVFDGYEVQYVKTYNGIEIGTGMDTYSLDNNRLYFQWYKDELEHMTLRPVLEIGDVVSINVELLPFSRIEKMLFDYFADNGIQGNGNNVSQYTINKIALEYVTVFDELSGQGLLVPAWDFYTHVNSQYTNGTLIQESEVQIISINAIDGKFLWFDSDYQ